MFIARKNKWTSWGKYDVLEGSSSFYVCHEKEYSLVLETTV